MSRNRCSEEEKVNAAFRSGEWSDELRQHTATCEPCRELMAVSGWLSAVAGDARSDVHVPDPGVIWLKAELFRRAPVAEEVEHSMNVVQNGIFLFLAACWALLLTAKWSLFSVLVHQFTPQNIVHASIFGGDHVPTSFLIILVSLVCVTVMMTVQGVFAEE